jgi:hypothetical protein
MEPSADVTYSRYVPSLDYMNYKDHSPRRDSEKKNAYPLLMILPHLGIEHPVGLTHVKERTHDIYV